MKRILLFTLLGLLLVGGIYYNRQGEVKRLGEEVAKVQAEKLTLQQEAIAMADLARIYAGKTDIAAFTDALYGCASQVGLRNHEVTTSAYREEQTARTGRGRKSVSDLKTQRLQVSLSGEFRKVAEYLDLLQKLESRQRITRFALVPGEKQLAATVVIDLYSLGGSHVR